MSRTAIHHEPGCMWHAGEECTGLCRYPMTVGTEDVITEDIALALSDLQRSSRYAGEMAHQPGAGMAEREEREARKDAEREISDVILRARRERDDLRLERDALLRQANRLRDQAERTVRDCDGLRVRCAELQAERARADAMRTLLAKLVDDRPCQYDHSGRCQAHSPYRHPCPHDRARALLVTA